MAGENKNYDLNKWGLLGRPELKQGRRKLALKVNEKNLIIKFLN